MAEEQSSIKPRKPLIMACGHASNAHNSSAEPCCVICSCAVPALDQPNLKGRKASCTYCGTKEPSSVDLAFFEYRGKNSRDSARCKHCGCYPLAHGDNGKCNTLKPNHYKAQGPSKTDQYYCGCKGWD